MTVTSFCDLPVEIIGLISEFSAIPNVVTLAQANRRAQSICFCFIYRTVELEDPVRTVKCLTTLGSNMLYAQAVRKLKLLYYPKYPFRRLLVAFRTALVNITNLETLHLSTHLHMFACLSDVLLPRLRMCSIPLALYTDSFVRRHPGLTSLSVLPDYHGEFLSGVPDLSGTHIHMPNLRMFIGPETFAFRVIPHSRASHISIMWNTHRLRLGISPSDDVATLALSSVNILTLENIVGNWDTALLSAITAGLPHLLSLEFWNISVSDLESLQAFISHFDATVSGLPSLTSLSILHGPQRPPGLLDPRDLDREFDTVRRWGDISPTLRCAVLPSETAWSRVYVQGNVWYPATKSPNIPDMIERVKWFLSLVVSSSRELSPGYVRIAEVVAGKETVSVLRTEVERLGRIPEFEVRPTATGMSLSFAVSEGSTS
ncbi:F-box domain-containing protein [Mycena sanguinolenta]|uniref:F-box domain-containing protein n=1 Tax=Mycena sanguinolenta TaxID=230812 RepID=A0A8H6XUI4_9AGAR|nr:F-box domain-containing protein [Mycena sanguinolenta]